MLMPLGVLIVNKSYLNVTKNENKFFSPVFDLFLALVAMASTKTTITIHN